MTELEQNQHIQLLQFMALMQNCKTETEMQELKEQYYNIPRYSFLQNYIPEKNSIQSFSSYKTHLIYDMDKYRQDYKFIYGENVPAYRKESMPQNKANYTVLNLLDEISGCDDIETYQKLLAENNNFPKAKIEALSSDSTGIYFSDEKNINGLPSDMIRNSPENNFNARKQLVDAGYSLFDLPSVDDVIENGIDWLHEEISHFKESLNPDFIDMENQMNQEPDFQENEYAEEFDNYTEEMYENDGMSSVLAEADYEAEQNPRPDYLENSSSENTSYGDEEYWKTQFLNDNAETFKALDDFLNNGIKPKNDEFIFSKVPEILKSANVSDNEIVIKTSVINKARNEHSLSADEIRKTVENIAVPVLIFDSDRNSTENKKDSYFSLTDTFAQNGKPIAFSMNLDSEYERKNRTIEVNEIRTIHDRTLVAKNGTDLIQKWTEDGLCRYVDDKKISEWSKAAGVQFPLAVLQSDGFRIQQNDGFVNEILSFSKFADEREEMEKEYQEWLAINSPDEESSRRIDSGEIFGDYEPEEKQPQMQERNVALEDGEEMDKGVEQIQANGGMDDAAAEADYEAEQNPRSGYLDGQGNPHRFDEEEETEVLSDSEIKQLKEQNPAEDKTAELSSWYDTVDWEDPIEAAEAMHNGTDEQVDYVITRRTQETETVNEAYIHSEEKNKNVVRAFDIWTEIKDLISEKSEYEAKKFAALDYLYNKGTDDAAGYENSFERNIPRLDVISKSDKHIEQIFEKYKDYKIDFDDQALAVKIAGTHNNNFNKAKQDFLDFIENKKYLRETELTQKQEVSLFDKELQEFIDGKLPKSHIFTLGKPSEILVKCGFPAEQRIELSASHLEFKSKLPRHTFNLLEIRGLEKAIQNPIAVFEYGDRTKSQNIIVNIEKDGKNFLTGVHFNQSTRGYEVSDIRTLYPKENVEWLNWINQGKLIYGDKEKLQALIAQQRMNVAEVSSQVAQSPLYEHCLESSLSILDKFGEVKDVFTDEYPFYEEVKKKAAIEHKFFSYYVTKGNLDARELSVLEGEEFYNAIKTGDVAKIDEYIKTDLHEINELAAEIYETYSKENNLEKEQDVSQKNPNYSENILTDNLKNTLSVEKEESKISESAIETESTAQEEPQKIEKAAEGSNYSNSRPQSLQELHKFFIENSYVPGTPVPTIAIRNGQTGHSAFIEGYTFARFEDIGRPNLAFNDKEGNQIKPDGQTVVLTKPVYKEAVNEITGKKELVPDEEKRLFIRISRDLYEQAISNSQIIAKRSPSTEQEKQKMYDDYLEAANLDEKRQRADTADNFWHNYQAGVMTLANNKQEAMAFAKRLVNEMIPVEREKFAAMVRKYEKLKGPNGKHLSYDQRILERYEDITKGLKITNNSIWRDHVGKEYDTLDAIKQNTEVFDKEGQPLDKTCRMKIGDTIKISVTADSALSNKKIKLPPQEYRLVAHSKDSNSVALISADGKQKIIKNREDFIKEVQKVEKRQIKKQQRQDKYESISM